MFAEVYDTFVSAGALEGKARAAANALNENEARFDLLEREITEIRGDLRLIKWMLAVVIAVTVLPAFKTSLGL